MKQAKGFTLIEVLIALTLLAILGAALIGVLPLLSRLTRASSIDTNETQRAISAFEGIADAWSNQTDWNNETVFGQPVTEYVQEVLVNTTCTVALSYPSVERRRIVVTCPDTGVVPERQIRAEFGDPG